MRRIGNQAYQAGQVIKSAACSAVIQSAHKCFVYDFSTRSAFDYGPDLVGLSAFAMCESHQCFLCDSNAYACGYLPN